LEDCRAGNKSSFLLDFLSQGTELQVLFCLTLRQRRVSLPSGEPGLRFVLTQNETPGYVSHRTHPSLIMSVFPQLDTEGQQLQNLLENYARAQALNSLTLDLISAPGLAPFSRVLTARVVELFGCSGSVLALSHGEQVRIVHLQAENLTASGRALRVIVGKGLAEVSQKQTQEILKISAGDVVGVGLADEIGWNTFLLAKLPGVEGSPLGLLCLIDAQATSPEDVELLRQLTNYVSVALENLRRISQVTQASRQWAEIFDSISDFLLLHDERDKVVRVNRALAESRKRHPGELVGLPVGEIFLPNADSGVRNCPFCLSHDENGKREEFFDPATHRTYLISSSRLVGIGENGRQTIHVLKDVTEHRETERLYRELFDNLQEGAYFSTPDGRFTEVNNAMVRMLGYSCREELLDVETPSRFYVSPSQKENPGQERSRFGVLKTQEVILRRKDGSLLHALETGFAVHDHAGQVAQFRGVILDISEIKRVQAQLKRERDFNTQILNNTQSMILVVDTAGLVSYANRKCYEVGARGSGELVGNRLEEIIATSHRRVLKNAFENTLEGHQINNLELPLVRGGELLGKFSANLSPMRDENGNVNSIVAVMTDVTDMATLQAKLVQTEKMAAVGQMVSGVAHEVNNPLTAILGFADLLLENSDVPESVRQELQVIMQEAQRTKEIIQNLLSFARQNPVRRSKVQINQILRRTITLRAYDFTNRGIALLEHFDEALPEVEGDAHQLQQVFLNILNNAYDAVCESACEGQVMVETAHTVGNVEVRFRDNGPGIKHIERIFDPFFTTKDVGKGTGLGLSICYGIMREHGGEISCFNNINGPGATFLLRVPIERPQIRSIAGSGI
jgi:two-component system, NtrC family, sensor kinase